ncbi:hypothetical protein SmJEL517_g05857 [Synchytrium microbalum]|uniref:DNA helicase n=1 Tax=Synchytrium microbalum TaxID=1806994 RepID=A0A507BSH7_9FUNG|nr:uncharacterized protein SmJEL517_g05857 [Synchytrium microbalum]TPX30622.1 hypothetical protein SmJEL517_g05857 [Synchytrium microbalum]
MADQPPNKRPLDASDHNQPAKKLHRTDTVGSRNTAIDLSIVIPLGVASSSSGSGFSIKKGNAKASETPPQGPHGTPKIKKAMKPTKRPLKSFSDDINDDPFGEKWVVRGSPEKHKPQSEKSTPSSSHEVVPEMKKESGCAGAENSKSDAKSIDSLSIKPSVISTSPYFAPADSSSKPPQTFTSIGQPQSTTSRQTEVYAVAARARQVVTTISASSPPRVLAPATDEASEEEEDGIEYQRAQADLFIAEPSNVLVPPSEFDIPVIDNDAQLASLMEAFPDTDLVEIQNALDACGGDASKVPEILCIQETEDEDDDDDVIQRGRKGSKRFRKAPRIGASSPSGSVFVVPDGATSNYVKPTKNRAQVKPAPTLAPEIVKPAKKTLPVKPAPILVNSDDMEVDDDELEDDDDTIKQRLMREEKALSFFSMASIDDIMEYTNCSVDAAKLVLQRERPFSSYRAMKKALASEKKSKHLLDKYNTTMDSFDSVDQFVNTCEKTGKEFAASLEKWAQEDDVVVSPTRSRKAPTIPSNSMEADDVDIENDDDDESDGGMALLTVDDKEVSSKLVTPKLLSPLMKLKSYQLIGVNWLYLLYKSGLGGILADEMGLGKTAQVIAWLALLKEKQEGGLSLIVVPSSVLDNWMREFEQWCPDLQVFPYFGNQNERYAQQREFKDDINSYDCILTTYNLISSNKEDRSFFKKLPIQSMILDEGHMVKNMTSNRYTHLMRLKVKQRLLLTGTPLQNNLMELLSLLTFIMPDIGEHVATLQQVLQTRSTGAEAVERIRVAKKIMKPFVLRRKKDQVLKELPPKISRNEYCTSTPRQRKLYLEIESQSKKDWAVAEASKSQKGKSKKDQAGAKKKTFNVLMQLRKAAIHPLLFRQLYSDDTVRKIAHELQRTPEYYDTDYDLVCEDLSVMSDFEIHCLCMKHSVLRPRLLTEEAWMDAGKIQKLKELLVPMKENEDKVLIFSQFVMVLDVLEKVLESLHMSFTRLDGSTDVSDRQDLIDEYNAVDSNTFIFLLSTKAGGQGLNLTAANVVIFMDLDFNPQNDCQAECRAHRVGQTRPVTVYKLISSNTIEEHILQLCERKLVLDERFQKGDEERDAESKESEKALMELLYADWTQRA